MRLLILGAPGSGKGTQGKRLSETFGVPHISAGEMIREQIALGTGFGRQIESRIAAGCFAPTEEMLDWISRRLQQPDAQQGYILDGFPRNLPQADLFHQILPVADALDAVVELSLEEAVLWKRVAGRWMCPACRRVYHDEYAPPQLRGQCDMDCASLVRRPEDDEKALQQRMQLYREITQPLRFYYGSRSFLLTIDAQENPQTVHENIVQRLKEFSFQHKNARLKV